MEDHPDIQYEVYETMVQNANSIILIWRTDGIIRFMNNFGLRFFEYTENELIGASIVGTIISDKDLHDKDLKIMVADIVANPEKYKNNENENITGNGEKVWVSWTNTMISNPETGEKEVLSVGNDITAKNKVEKERVKLISDLQVALKKIKQLSGLLPLCSHCKKIRDDKGYWNQIDHYIAKHSDADISHGICPECAEKYYPEMDLYGDDETQE